MFIRKMKCFQMGYSNGRTPRAANVHAYVNDTDPLQETPLDWGGMYLVGHRRMRLLRLASMFPSWDYKCA